MASKRQGKANGKARFVACTLLTTLLCNGIPQ
jgi:hypothetical protein